MAEEYTEQQVQGLKCPEPEPTPQQEECVETVQLTGTVTANCCCDCPKLRTRTIRVNISPQTAVNVAQAIQAQANNLEANGWVVLGHSIVEAGPAGGVSVVISLGFYV